jgi:hypothetical protein
MKPLNPGDVIWLVGSAEEVDTFLKDPQVRDRGLLLGHPEDAKRCLILHATPSPTGAELIKLSREPNLEVCFLLLEGKVIGLIKQEPKK